MTIAWLIVEVVIGVLLAGVLSGAIVGAGARWGTGMAPWVAWLTVAVCVLATVAIGERIRRRTRS